MSATAFEKSCIVRGYLPSTTSNQIIVLKYENDNIDQSFTPTIHNLHLFHLCHNLQTKQDITFLHVFPKIINARKIKTVTETLQNSHGVQNPEHKVIREDEENFKAPLNTEYIFDVPFNNMKKQLPVPPRRTKTVIEYDRDRGYYKNDSKDIFEFFFYLYPIIAMRESIFRYDKKYSNLLREFMKEYLQDLKFIGEPENAFNQHVFKLFPWNNVYYEWYNHSKVIHYYNILFLLFHVGGDINEDYKAKIEDLHNIPFHDREKREAWKEVCRSFNDSPFYDNVEFNNPLDYNEHKYVNQRHIWYDKKQQMT